ncbi:hypothetical protein ACFWYW_28415 [Nonomuraea sp. NPDC059023]|uniref:hypothetical protein n=1 Tax=unclassified Nonomuraea TaxID=2593643 RepID=UPI003683CBF8
MTKHELAIHFGLVDENGKPQVFTIGRRAASGEWPSHMPNGKLRFSPEDVAAIEDMLRHPATRRREAAKPEQVEQRVRRQTKQNRAGRGASPRGAGLLGLIDFDAATTLKNRRGSEGSA